MSFVIVLNDQILLATLLNGLQCLSFIGRMARPYIHGRFSTRTALTSRQYDKYPDLPLGPPHLMASFTSDGQLHEKQLQERDE